jgi:hypothetical protein
MSNVRNSTCQSPVNRLLVQLGKTYLEGTYAKTYESKARQEEAKSAPAQSISVLSFVIFEPSTILSGGRAQMFTKMSTSVAPPHRYHPVRHPTLSRKTPPSTRPRENPKGCTRPKQENPMLRFLPVGTASAIIATDVGRQSETAIACRARNIINSIPVLARPQPMMNHPSRKHPVKLIRRFPTTSATDPARSRQEPLVNLRFH